MNNKNQIEDLIKLCASNDSDAQKQLFIIYYSKLMTICLRYTDNQDDAKDVLNESFLKIFQNIQSFNHQGSFEGWLKRIVSNTAIDFVRTNYKHKNTQSIHAFQDISSDFGYVDALSNLAEKDLLTLIQQLPPMTRSVFNLAVFENMSHKEIAQILGMKEGTSMWHLNNARNILKRQLYILAQETEVIYG